MTVPDIAYDAVIATLNRPDSLLACLTQLEAQTEKPRRVIVVDASDDHEAVRSRVMKERDPSIDWLFLQSDVRSSPYQRNLGVRHVEHEVAFLPDDDSMLHPTAAAEMMAAYRADTAGEVAGVSAVGVDDSPIAGRVPDVSRGRALKEWVAPVRDRLEDRFVTKPFASYPKSIWRTRQIPAWIDGDRFALVSSVGGYRLSLRADLVKAHPFDETLGYGIGYALHEDMELSMRLHRLGYLLVGAQRAWVHHDVHPSQRAGGYNYGFCWIANYIYGCRRNLPEDSRSWSRDLPRFLRYKVALYAVRAAVRRDRYSRDVLDGARAAWTERAALMASEPEDLPSVYRAMCDRHIQR